VATASSDPAVTSITNGQHKEMFLALIYMTLLLEKEKIYTYISIRKYKYIKEVNTLFL
jgi:hypothetical protein